MILNLTGSSARTYDFSLKTNCTAEDETPTLFVKTHHFIFQNLKSLYVPTLVGLTNNFRDYSKKFRIFEIRNSKAYFDYMQKGLSVKDLFVILEDIYANKALYPLLEKYLDPVSARRDANA